MGKEDDTRNEAARRLSRSWFERNMPPNTANTGKERRKHRSSASGSKHQTKSRPKTTGTRKESEIDTPRPRHRRRSTSSTSSSSDEDDQDHRAVLAATRNRLTSPSMVSTYTALTNKSSGSSGSNSTVTQASVTKRSSLGKQPAIEEAPLSPAVPDAPDVFAFLDETQSILEKDYDRESGSDGEHHQGEVEEAHAEDDDDEDDDEEEDQEHEVGWPTSRKNYVQSSLPSHVSPDQSSSSSASSSFHGEDEFLQPAVDHDTDRSTSPERSVKDHDSEHEDSLPTDPVSVKVASQMAAAQQRQNRHESLNPHLQRVNTSLPHTPSSAMTPRYHQPQKTQPFSPGHRLPESGYEQLALRLSSHRPDNDNGPTIKPMYRKFEALNHRVLLYLQDEISELEETLHHIDQAETQSRRTDRQIIPASRRASVQAGGQLQWDKSQVLAQIGYKLSQYNQALSSFNTTQSLNPPDPEDISAYRTYLETENPIVEAETHFLDPTDDLVSVYSETLRPPPSSYRAASYATSTYSTDGHSHSPPSTFPPSPIPFDISTKQNTFTGPATAIAVSILVPILTFNVIPNFIGRITVTGLVAIGVVWALVQSKILSRSALFGKEGMTCAGMYGGFMIIMAGII